MLLDRRIDRFAKSRHIAQETSRQQLELILANQEALLRVRKGEEMLEVAKKFDLMLQRDEDLTPAQYNYLDGIYEAMWKGAGYDSVNLHHDKPKATLRHPK